MFEAAMTCHSTVLIGVAHRGHRADRHQGDEGAEHRVFEQVLTVFTTDRPNECNKAIHDGHSHSWGAQVVEVNAPGTPTFAEVRARASRV